MGFIVSKLFLDFFKYIYKTPNLAQITGACYYSNHSSLRRGCVASLQCSVLLAHLYFIVGLHTVKAVCVSEQC